jgi:rubrerythrin
LKKDELAIIKQAMLNEIEGYEFYKMASANADLSEVKETLLMLASEEKKHVEWLEELFHKIKDDKLDSLNLAELENPPSPGIFKWEKVDRSHIGVAVSSFGIGMQMEKASVEYYEQAMEKTEIKEAKELYRILASWEKNHLEMFSKEYDVLAQDWWDDQAFQPF